MTVQQNRSEGHLVLGEGGAVLRGHHVHPLHGNFPSGPHAQQTAVVVVQLSLDGYWGDVDHLDVWVWAPEYPFKGHSRGNGRGGGLGVGKREGEEGWMMKGWDCDGRRVGEAGEREGGEGSDGLTSHIADPCHLQTLSDGEVVQAGPDGVRVALGGNVDHHSG